MNKPARSKITCTIKPYIQPFEKELAIDELETKAGALPRKCEPNRTKGGLFEVTTNALPEDLASSLAYWETIKQREVLRTAQVKREATMVFANNDTPLKTLAFAARENSLTSLPKRRCLRYGPHGLHEYRGKFFPQLVVSLLNIAALPKGAKVLDPMCGSGTALVESILAGQTACGLDINPLSVFMTRTKCEILRVSATELLQSFDALSSDLSNRAQIKRRNLKMNDHRLDEPDLDFLSRWFDEKILLALNMIYSRTQIEPNVKIRNFYHLVLSNCLRPLSWQKTDDLRVRKEKWDASVADPINDFLRECERSTRLVVAFLSVGDNIRLGRSFVNEGTAIKMPRRWLCNGGKFDCLITSPPYATALPYLDTDRLSLVFLGLLTRKNHKHRDLKMIGNREITDKIRVRYWNYLQSNKSNLPNSAVSLIEEIDSLNTQSGAGFRRLNLPALLSKYFFDMKAVFGQMKMAVKPGAPIYIIVGDNHTVAGGVRISIPTANLLAEIASAVGLKVEKEIGMEMLVSRDIFRGNASSGETILCLRNST